MVFVFLGRGGLDRSLVVVNESVRCLEPLLDQILCSAKNVLQLCSNCTSPVLQNPMRTLDRPAIEYGIFLFTRSDCVLDLTEAYLVA